MSETFTSKIIKIVSYGDPNKPKMTNVHLNTPEDEAKFLRIHAKIVEQMIANGRSQAEIDAFSNLQLVQ